MLVWVIAGVLMAGRSMAWLGWRRRGDVISRTRTLHGAMCSPRGIAVWGLICVALAQSLAVSACGGATAPTHATHYSNANYNFAFDYEAPLEVTHAPPSGYKFVYAVGQRPSQSNQKATPNWLVISVEPGSGSEDPRLFGTVWLRGQTKDARAVDSFSLIARRQTTQGGQPAFLFEGTGSESGKAVHFKNLYVVTPTYAYQLIARAEADVWNGTVGRQIQQSLSSFRLLHSPPAATSGGQSSLATATTYRNSAFRFSFRYPIGFSKVSREALPNPTANAADFVVGLLDTSAAQASQTSILDGVLVQVYRLPKKLTPAQAAYVLRYARAVQQKQTKTLYERTYPGANVSAIRMGRFNGLPCYVFAASYPYNGGQEYEKTYYLMVGRFAYQIQLSSPQADWSANKGTLERIAHSFRTF
jgi:hypothetical protein